MSMSDPISDLVTRIRNASSAKKEYVDVPASSFKEDILKVLKKEGFIQDYKKAEESGHPWLRVYLKFTQSGEKVIQGIERVSLPGRRVYADVADIPRVQGGMGVAILSTSQGVITGQKAKSLNTGGEVLCKVW
ncbi:MAG: 30S ribosomal protein S8 [Chlamydiae bacterium]|nr:30S ribosomal protein S8 [Chlamydiota bacterium]MBI3277746.1 30S ribosomal protein S8 [Chlamydiota bacterium]